MGMGRDEHTVLANMNKSKIEFEQHTVADLERSVAAPQKSIAPQKRELS